MRLVKLFVCLMLLSASTEMYGQTKKVVRQQKAPETQKNAGKAKTQQKAKFVADFYPTDMKKGIYYMCIMESWNLANSKAVCRKMAAKGYSPALVQIAKEHDMGFFICIKQYKDKASAEKFARSFSDDRYELAYIFYNDELQRYNEKSGILEKW